jgi:hypothetical protein
MTGHGLDSSASTKCGEFIEKLWTIIYLAKNILLHGFNWSAVQ